MLSTLAHRQIEIAQSTVDAISPLPADRTKLYFDQILLAVAPADRKLLEARMQGYVYQSEFARRYYEEGRKEALQQSLQALVHAKLRVITPAEQATLAAVHGAEEATAWITALGKAKTAAAVRAILAHGPARRRAAR